MWGGFKQLQGRLGLTIERVNIKGQTGLGCRKIKQSIMTTIKYIGTFVKHVAVFE